MKLLNGLMLEKAILGGIPNSWSIRRCRAADSMVHSCRREKRTVSVAAPLAGAVEKGVAEGVLLPQQPLPGMLFYRGKEYEKDRSDNQTV